MPNDGHLARRQEKSRQTTFERPSDGSNRVKRRSRSPPHAVSVPNDGHAVHRTPAADEKTVVRHLERRRWVKKGRGVEVSTVTPSVAAAMHQKRRKKPLCSVQRPENGVGMARAGCKGVSAVAEGQMQRAAARKRQRKRSCRLQQRFRSGGRANAACSGAKTTGEALVQAATAFPRRRQDSCIGDFRCLEAAERCSGRSGRMTNRIGTEKRIYIPASGRYNPPRTFTPSSPIE